MRDIDRGYDRFVDRVRRLEATPPHVTVGIHAAEGAEAHPTAAIPVVDVAALAEFGTSRQPPRSFLRVPVDTAEPELARKLEQAAEAYLEGGSLEDAFGEVGLELRESMLEAMDSSPALDEDTVEAKGDATPLEETGALREAVRVRVSGREVQS